MTVVDAATMEPDVRLNCRAAASTLIVATLIPVASLYRLVRRYELGS